MGDTYEACLKRLVDFRESLPKTSIKFLYFYASDMTKPKIRDEFHSWNLEGDKCYLIQGLTKNAVYVYKESVIKYIISSMIPTVTSNEYNVTVSGENGDVNHGDHIDFTLVRQRNGTLLIKSHKTVYEDDQGDFVFSRDEYTCNFRFNKQLVDNCSSSDFGKKVMCENKYGPTGKILGLEYLSTDTKIVHSLCQVVSGKQVMTGSGKRATRQYVHHNGKRYMLQVGIKGGRFIQVSKKRRVYHQRGGWSGYKGITFFTDTFIDFLVKKFLKPLYQIRIDLVTIQILFDENNELCQNANQHILFLYDFLEHTRSIFSIDSTIAIVGCYCEQQTEAGLGNLLTEYEKVCYQKLNDITSKHITSQVSSV